MKNMLSLTKIGNLKLGIVKNGKPIQTSRILVTRPTKEGGENFQILDGFDSNGETKVNITLPFNDNSLNFEVNYVGFLQLNNVAYISKSKGLGEDLILYPLEVENFDLPSVNVGPLTEDLIKFYNLERTGFLKCMITGVSGFGEVFYFKTKSVHSIRAIEDQLRILSSLTGGNIAGIPLVLKPVKKDLDEKQILYISIAFEQDLISLGKLVKKALKNPVNIEAFEDDYIESRIPELVTLTETDIVKVERDLEDEIKIIQDQVSEEKAEETKEELVMKSIIADMNVELAVPNATIYAVFSAMKYDKVIFREFLSGKPTLQDCLLKLKELKN